MKIIIIGASGFVGKNLLEILSNTFSIVGTGRNSAELLMFDYNDSQSWDNIVNENPDVIINAAAYGVVKTEIDLESMYNINYFNLIKCYNYLNNKLDNLFWIQIGTAFEYDLNIGELSEESTTQPFTHYGISKLMASQYFFNYVDAKNYIVLRPFGMFGKYESETKIFPALINAQLNKNTINLSSGTQERDYMYVKDFCKFIAVLLNKELSTLPNLINVGSGQKISLRLLSEHIKSNIANFNAIYWNWGEINHREGESDYFYNASKLAFEYGLELTNYEKAFSEILKEIQWELKTK